MLEPGLPTGTFLEIYFGNPRAPRCTFLPRNFESLNTSSGRRITKVSPIGSHQIFLLVVSVFILLEFLLEVRIKVIFHEIFNQDLNRIIRVQISTRIYEGTSRVLGQSKGYKHNRLNGVRLGVGGGDWKSVQVLKAYRLYNCNCMINICLSKSLNCDFKALQTTLKSSMLYISVSTSVYICMYNPVASLIPFSYRKVCLPVCLPTRLYLPANISYFI